jgi:hypothetical protein
MWNIFLGHSVLVYICITPARRRVDDSFKNDLHDSLLFSRPA